MTVLWGSNIRLVAGIKPAFGSNILSLLHSTFMAQGQCISIVALATWMIKNKLKILDFLLLPHLNFLMNFILQN